MKLSRFERLSLWNQYELLKASDEDLRSDCEEKQEILQSGFEPLYSSLFVHIEEEELSQEDYDFVRDVFDMYEGLRRYEERTKTKIDHPYGKFSGYDGNNEGNLYSIAKFLVETQNRWKQLGITCFNSHSQIQDTYSRMLEVWKEISIVDRISHLQTEQVKAILAATNYPTDG